MTQIYDAAFDAALDKIRTDGTVLHACSADPANYAGLAAVTLANKTGLVLTANADGAVSGRSLTIPVFADGTVTTGSTVTATHWVLTNGTDTIVASNTLAVNRAFAPGDDFKLNTALIINFPDAVTPA
jgi:hypothetical protein